VIPMVDGVVVDGGIPPWCIISGASILIIVSAVVLGRAFKDRRKR
jgi:hypothetical protein